MMQSLGIIGGSGFYEFPELEHATSRVVDTQFGRVEITEGVLDSYKVLFLPRHGATHHLPPHKVNYRSNIAALSQAGANAIIGVNACGGITPKFSPGALIVPDQIVDYTFGREHTFFDGSVENVEHVDFTEPFDEGLRRSLINALNASDVSSVDMGTYACTQGPRLETKAEIKKLKNDGCDLVGMTLMPEAALAREKAIPYASLCLIVNWAAGIKQEIISLNNIMALLDSSVPTIRDLLRKTVRFL